MRIFQNLIFILAVCALIPVTAFGKEIRWAKNYESGLAEAKKSNKPIFVDIYADWCAWCHELDKQVYTNEDFIRFMNGFVAIKVNAEEEPEGTRLAEKFSVEAFPTLLVLDSLGNPTNRIEGYLDATDLINEINSMMELQDSAKKDPADEEVAMELLEAYLQKGMADQAEQQSRKMLAATSMSQENKSLAAFALALVLYERDKLQEAATTLESSLPGMEEPETQEATILMLCQIYLELEHPDKARAYLQTYLDKFPEGEEFENVEALLAELDQEGQPRGVSVTIPVLEGFERVKSDKISLKKN
jgi:thioredoxin-like negative regulator of GroEL